jgi:alpha-tubulin suppressor-like RCC1 family protein
MPCKRSVPLVGCVILFLTACDGGIGGGDGSEINADWPEHVYTTPTRLPTTLSFDKIGLGFNHSCMLTAAGEAYCWGSNQEGQLGTASAMQLCSGGTVRCSPTPLRVVGIPGLASIDGSVRHTCALTLDGAAWCWGMGLGGQLGDGLRTNSSAPVAVSGGLRFVALDVGIGGLVSCGIATDALTYCWGPGDQGGLGNGTTDGADHPTPVATSLRFTTVAVGDNHACALVAIGDAYCWGRNTFGKLGNGAPGAQLVPTSVVGGYTFRAIAAGGEHTCALTNAGLAYCWGFGQSLGNGSDAGQNVPVAVSGNHEFVTLRAGYQHTCALTSLGEAFCWGPLQGRNGTVEYRLTPVAVGGSLRFRALDAGGVVTCGIATDGVAYCWGSNNWGAVGQPDMDQ